MSKILVARTGQLGFVKVVGRGSFQNSSCLKAFYLQLLKEGVNQFVIDLGSCTYLDSTFLGILLGLGLKLKETGGSSLNILNASARNLELLRNLGLDRLITVSSSLVETAPKVQGALAAAGNGSSAPPAALSNLKEESLKSLPCAVPTREEAAPTILEAHEALMKFDPRNVPKFKDVVEFLREDLGQGGKS
jgi:anti-anti-sigma factor